MDDDDANDDNDKRRQSQSQKSDIYLYISLYSIRIFTTRFIPTIHQKRQDKKRNRFVVQYNTTHSLSYLSLFFISLLYVFFFLLYSISI